MTALVATCAIGYAVWEGRDRGRAPTSRSCSCSKPRSSPSSCARDLILFYVGFEAMLIPFYFLIGIYGGPNRRRATLKLIIYTFVGTLLMLVGILALGLQAKGGPPSASTPSARATSAGSSSPSRSRSRSSRRSGPSTAGCPTPTAPRRRRSRRCSRAWPRRPARTASCGSRCRSSRSRRPSCAGAIVALATIGLLYGSIVAFRQPDSRGVIAYSSIGQMGLIVLGIFLISARGEDGAALQMVNHGLLSAALFLIAGWLAVTTGAERFDQLGGLARGRPILATICIIVGVATLAVPGSSTFASEFLILLGAFERHWCARRDRRRRDRPRGDVHAALDLGRAPRPRGRRRRRDRPPDLRSGRSAPCCRSSSPCSPVVRAERGHPPRRRADEGARDRRAGVRSP